MPQWYGSTHHLRHVVSMPEMVPIVVVDVVCVVVVVVFVIVVRECVSNPFG